MQHVCFERSQSVSQSTVKPVAGQTQRLKTSQELEDDRITTILEIQREHLLSGAKSEVLKYGAQTGIAENSFPELKNKVELQEMEMRRANDGYAYFRSQRDLLHGETGRPRKSSVRH